MRPPLLIACFLLFSTAHAQDEVAVPFEEYKTLFREHVERELREQPPPKNVHTVEQAQYTLQIDAARVTGAALLTGRVVSGTPEAFKILGSEAAITEMVEVSGGALVRGDDGANFLPDPAAPAFHIALRFTVPSTEAAGTRAVTLPIAESVQNQVQIQMAEGIRLADLPGQETAEGTYHLARASAIELHYINERSGAASIIEVDTLTELSVQRDRVLMRLWMLPKRAAQEAVVVNLPAEAQLISTSMVGNAVEPMGDGKFSVELSRADAGAAYVEFLLDQVSTSKASVQLPTIEGNRGQQGRFIVREPSDGEVEVAAGNLVTGLPIDRLGEALAKAVPEQTTFAMQQGDPLIEISLQQYEAADAAATVVEAQSVFSVIEENGAVLTTLVLDLPKDWGKRLRIAPVPNAEVWALRVNDATQQAYIGEDGAWIVPLEPAAASHVELSYLTHGEKLALEGRVEIPVPATGVASQALNLGVALPERLELTALEGPVSTTDGAAWKAPKEFQGKRFFFSRAFYKGEGMKLSIGYKEPVDRAMLAKGAE